MKYVLPAKEKTYIPISKDIQKLLKIYAREHHITITEAVYRLLLEAFSDELKGEEQK